MHGLVQAHHSEYSGKAPSTQKIVLSLLCSKIYLLCYTKMYQLCSTNIPIMLHTLSDRSGRLERTNQHENVLLYWPERWSVQGQIQRAGSWSGSPPFWKVADFLVHCPHGHSTKRLIMCHQSIGTWRTLLDPPLTAVSRNTILRHLDTPPKNFRPPWLRIATVFPVFFYTYYHVAYALYCDVR